jgi:hypothetical protein
MYWRDVAMQNTELENGKRKLTIEEQIIHMKDEKGILFSIMSEEDAKIFLQSHTYYFKIKAYAKNYEKYNKGPKAGKYVNLEFAYLKELSTIDMHLRNIIMLITTGVEHYLKTRLLEHFSNNTEENGYDIINAFFSAYPHVETEISRKCENSACSDLVLKYQDKWAIWNVVEVIPFGDFVNLYLLYNNKYHFDDDIVNCLWSVKFLRNAAVHSNCLINSLRIPYMSSPCPKNPCSIVRKRNKPCTRTFSKTRKVNSFLSLHLKSNRKIDSQTLKTMMSNPVVHDFITTIYVYNLVSSRTAAKYMMTDLKNLFENRIVRNKDYFAKNQVLLSTYNFVKVIIDYFYDRNV